MSDYTIITDSSCDLPDGLVKELELEVLPLFEDGLNGVGGLAHVDGVGGGHDALLLLAVELSGGHIAVIRIVPVRFAVHDKGQGQDL